jgi:ribulose-phosphate 3-epimerase
MGGTMALLAPSLLSADLTDLTGALKAVSVEGVRMIHLDIMDGHFVPEITFGSGTVLWLKQKTKLELDCHLMVSNPEEQIPLFAKAGADWVTIHAECGHHLHRMLAYIHELGCKAGVSLNPATPLTNLAHILGDVDLVLLMSVNPGYGGQKFIPAVLPKIIKLRETINGAGLQTKIQVDGGVGPANIREIVNGGADIIVVGSAIFSSPDPSATAADLAKIIA